MNLICFDVRGRRKDDRKNLSSGVSGFYTQIERVLLKNISTI